ncbi:hypothetical protein WJX74_003565 [Apatococcus lobatus]|uniref:Uncharacterized protein n=1 Tax=Apatococcus lobatus TaxID=904363 RepID=A0AAW1REX4_9CHLO
MQQHQAFRDDIRAVCCGPDSPFQESSLFDSFNNIRLNQNDKTHHSSWESILPDIQELLKSGCMLTGSYNAQVIQGTQAAGADTSKKACGSTK